MALRDSEIRADSPTISAIEICKPDGVVLATDASNVEWVVYRYRGGNQSIAIYFCDDKAHSAMFTEVNNRSAEEWYFYNCEMFCEHIAAIRYREIEGD